LELAQLIDEALLVKKQCDALHNVVFGELIAISTEKQQQLWIDEQFFFPQSHLSTNAFLC
jgi:hypothetical protein